MKKLLFVFFYFPVFCHAQIIGRQIIDSFPIYDWSVYPTSGLTYGLTYLPPDYATTTKLFPVIFQLPGTGQTGTGIAQLSNLNTDGLGQLISGGWGPQAVNPIDQQAYEFIVITPMNGNGWAYLYDQMKYIVPNALGRYRIDPTRVYLHGFSAGGDGAYTCISADTNFTKLFAAAAIASSAPMDGSNGLTPTQEASNLKQTAKTYQVGVWNCIGTQDKIESIPYVDSLNWLSPAKPVKYTYLNGVGHSAWKNQESTSFRPVANYYGKVAENFAPQPNTNGSSTPGTGKTQDSLNMYEWFLTFKRPVSGSSIGGGTSGGSTGNSGNSGGTIPPRTPQRFKIQPGVLPNIAPADDMGINIPAGSLIPGDTVDISNAYAWTYGSITAIGTKAKPIIVINSGNGQATFTGGFTLRAQYLHMTGTGVAGLTDGFYLTNPTPNLRSQGPFAMTITDSSAYVEVDHLLIYHVGIGFNIKNENSCDPGLQYPAWVINHISIHDNRIIGCWDEGAYLGNTSPDNGKNSYDPRAVICNGDTVYPLPLRVGSIHFYNNFIDSSGRGGVQIESTDTSISEIDSNTIMHCGMNGDDAQGTAISTGSYAHAYIHDNTGKLTYTWNIAGLGFTYLIIQNNHFDSAGFLIHYNRSNTSDQTFDPAIEPVYPDTLSWVQSGFWKTVPTLFGDSSTAVIQNNTWGTCRRMSQQLDLLDQYGLFKKGTPITFCNNTGSNGTSPINLETPTIPYTVCSSGGTGSNNGGNSGCPTCPTCPAAPTIVSAQVYIFGQWITLPTGSLKITLSNGTTQNY